MKKIIIISTFSLTTVLALVVAFTFGVPHKRTVAADTPAAYVMNIDETVNPSNEIVIQPCEMAASKIKEALLAELQVEPKRSSNDKFFFEYHPSSPKLLACLLMATKEHAAARKLLEGNGRLDLDRLRVLRDHKATCDVMRELEILEGQRMSNVVQKLVEIVKGLDVQPAEADVDERIREIALTLKHVALIPDGNRRWAKKRGLPSSEGHKKGFLEIAPALFQESWRLGIHTFTLWCCSTSNIDKRDPEEVKYFLFCFNGMLETILPLARKNQVRIVHLGRKDRLPKELLETIQKVEKETLNYKKHVLNVAIDYSGRDEIINACKTLMQQDCTLENITEDKLSFALNKTQQQYPIPDLVMRTGNELRTSGFMSWQIGYSELYFTKKHFPDFDVASLKEAIIDFGSRERRLGK